MENRAVIYTRVSDPSQIENNSLETQEKICRQYIANKGYEFVDIFVEEGESAKHVYTRTKLTELVRFCGNKKNQISYLIVYKMDRLSRNMVEGLQLITELATCGVTIRSATEQFGEDAAGRFLKNIVMAAAQYDNENKGEKVKDNMQSAFRGGLWPFKCPIGYKRRFKSKEENKGLPVIQHPELAPILTQMFKDASTGIYSKSQLARMMNKAGFADYYRVPADHKIVNGILEKTFYYGKMYAPKWKEYALGQHTPLIDEQTWQMAYHYLILKKKSYHFQDESRYPLKGYLLCGYCNHPMTTSPTTGNGGFIPYYECRYKGCKKLRINIKAAHEQFNDILKQLKPGSISIKLFETMIFSEWDQVIGHAKLEIEKTEKRIGTMKSELKSIRKAKDDGTYTPEEAKEEAERVRREIAVLEIERSDIKIQQYDMKLVKAFAKKFFENMLFLWNDLDLPKRQAFINKVLEGSLNCATDRTIRTIKLSPCVEIIKVWNEQKDDYVTPLGFEPKLPG